MMFAPTSAISPLRTATIPGRSGQRTTRRPTSTSRSSRGPREGSSADTGSEDARQPGSSFPDGRGRRRSWTCGDDTPGLTRVSPPGLHDHRDPPTVTYWNGHPSGSRTELARGGADGGPASGRGQDGAPGPRDVEEVPIVLDAGQHVLGAEAQ